MKVFDLSVLNLLPKAEAVQLGPLLGLLVNLYRR